MSADQAIIETERPVIQDDKLVLYVKKGEDHLVKVSQLCGMLKTV